MPKNKSIHREAALAAQKAAWEGTLSEVPEKTLAEIIGVSVQMVRLYRDGKNLLPMDAVYALLQNEETYWPVNEFSAAFCLEPNPIEREGFFFAPQA